MQVKQYFLTFPQCEVPKGTVAGRLREKFGDELECFIIAAEHHAATEQDPVGGPHLHLMIHFKERKSISSPTYFDFLCDKHCNIQKQRESNLACVKYLTKEDKEPIAFGIDIQAVLARKKSIFAEVAELVKQGKTIEEIDELHPGHVYPNKRKLEEYISFHEAKRRRTGEVLTGTLELEGFTIPLGVDLPFRTAQYYIYGESGIGKTTIINRLTDAGLVGYPLPLNGHFDDWSDSYDFAYFDEFKSQMTITMLNTFLDGSKTTLPCRYQNKKKQKNVPTFLLSNLPLEEQYHNQPPAITQALATRLNVIHLTARPTMTLTLTPASASVPMTIIQSSVDSNGQNI